MIWEEGHELILAGFLMTALKFAISKSFVMTKYPEVNYLLNASNYIVVSFI